jgi:hypothetical protein
MARTSVSGHIASRAHSTNLAAWKMNQEISAQQAQQLHDGVSAAYTPGNWQHTVNSNYHNPQPFVVLPALPKPTLADLPGTWPALEHISIVPPPEFDPEIKWKRLAEQVRIIHQLAKERDKFGEQFFDENNKTLELREAFEALGKMFGLLLHYQ